MRKVFVLWLAFSTLYAARFAVAQSGGNSTPDLQDARMLGLFVPATRFLTTEGRLRPGVEVEVLVSKLVQAAAARARRTSASPCFYPPQPNFGFSPGPATTKPESTLRRFGRLDAVMVGRVVSVTPGLNPQRGTAANLVTLQVERSITGLDPGPGNSVTYLTTSGSLEINGVRVCAEVPGERVPAVGDRLVVGGMSQPQSRHIHLANFAPQDVLQVRQGDQVSIPVPGKESSLTTLGDLEAEVRSQLPRNTSQVPR